MLRTLSASLSLSATLLALQVHCRFPEELQVLTPALKPAAGARPGSERWVVLFKTRGFDLTAYRAAAQARPGSLAPGVAASTVADLAAQMEQDQRPFVAQVQALGGRVTHQWWLVNGCAVEVEPGQVAQLQALPNVLRVHPDLPRHPGIKTATNAQNHATDLVQQAGILGQGVTVALIDSGVDVNMAGTGRPHAAFFVNGDVNNRTGGGLGGSRLLANVQVGAMNPDDLIAHGTAVAGVMAGERWNQTAVADRGHAPAARIVSYCVADDAVGGTWLTTLITAWQRVAADRLNHGIVVVNCSYEGYFDMSFGDQLAIEELARSGDVVVTGMGGNEGGSSQPAIFAYGAVNMLAVGATLPDTRAVAAFSSRGPTYASPTRFYPDLVANGAGVVMPQADNEAGQRTSSGTSYSAPQVAGAAALYRSVRSQATAREVKAAILASTEDVGARNLSETRQGYGVGYLRVDDLINVAAGRGLIVNQNLARATVSQNHVFAVQQGHYYNVALVWFRHDPTAVSEISNLDLEVAQGATLLGRSSTPANAYEFVRFRAPATGLVTFTLRNVTMEAGVNTLPYALVATETGPYYVLGSATGFGLGCGGVALLSVSGTPLVGGIYSVRYPGNTTVPTILATGASSSNWLGVPLPLSLSGAGFLNCVLYASIDLTQLFTGSQTGGTIIVSLPNDPVLVGASLFHQAITFPGAQTLATTNAVRVVVGGQP